MQARWIVLATFVVAGCHDADPAADAKAAQARAAARIAEQVKLRTIGFATGLRDRMCNCADQPCVDAVNRTYAEWLVAQARAAQTAPPSADTKRQLGELAASLARCQASIAAAARPDPTAALTSPGIPQACLDYQTALAHLGACRALPKTTRDGLVETAKTLAGSWGAVGAMSATNRKSVSDSCATATKALRDAGRSMHCKI